MDFLGFLGEFLGSEFLIKQQDSQTQKKKIVKISNFFLWKYFDYKFIYLKQKKINI